MIRYTTRLPALGERAADPNSDLAAKCARGRALSQFAHSAGAATNLDRSETDGAYEGVARFAVAVADHNERWAQSRRQVMGALHETVVNFIAALADEIEGWAQSHGGWLEAFPWIVEVLGAAAQVLEGSDTLTIVEPAHTRHDLGKAIHAWHCRSLVEVAQRMLSGAEMVAPFPGPTVMRCPRILHQADRDRIDELAQHVEVHFDAAAAEVIDVRLTISGLVFEILRREAARWEQLVSENVDPIDPIYGPEAARVQRSVSEATDAVDDAPDDDMLAPPGDTVRAQPIRRHGPPARAFRHVPSVREAVAA